MMLRPLLVGEINDEIARQYELKRAGKFEKTARDGNDLENTPVLVEEVLEVNQALLGVVRKVNDKQSVREELIQVIAVAAQWVARIDDEDERGLAALHGMGGG